MESQLITQLERKTVRSPIQNKRLYRYTQLYRYTHIIIFIFEVNYLNNLALNWCRGLIVFNSDKSRAAEQPGNVVSISTGQENNLIELLDETVVLKNE